MTKIHMMLKVGTIDVLVTIHIPEESSKIKAMATSAYRTIEVTIPWLRYYGPNGNQTISEQDLKK